MILYATVVPYNYNPVDSEKLDPSEVKKIQKITKIKITQITKNKNKKLGKFQSNDKPRRNNFDKIQP
jgi:hypothetical protein